MSTQPNADRILALDLGRRRIGLAVSDELSLTAQGLPTLERTNNLADIAALAKLAAEHSVGRFLVGKPIHMSGDEGRQAVWVRQFAGNLEARTGVPVTLWDERLTTVEAQRVLRQSGVSIEKRGRAIDRLAAVLLLQNYLDHRAFAIREERSAP